MSKTFDVAVVGATGLVGETMIAILEERDFPVGRLYALASERSAGRELEFRGETVVVEPLSEFDFGKVEFGLFSAGGSISAEYAPRAAAAGCIVIDNTSKFRYDDDVPLIVPYWPCSNGNVERMHTPGAAMSTAVPQFEKFASVSSSSVLQVGEPRPPGRPSKSASADTVIALGTYAGE